MTKRGRVLKKCPWCGKRPNLFRLIDLAYLFKCSDECEILMSTKYICKKKEAISAWNRRVIR